MIKNNTFNNLKHSLVHFQWDNYRVHELNSDENPYINKSELKILLKLKYHNEFKTYYDGQHYKYPFCLIKNGKIGEESPDESQGVADGMVKE